MRARRKRKCKRTRNEKRVEDTRENPIDPNKSDELRGPSEYNYSLFQWRPDIALLCDSAATAPALLGALWSALAGKLVIS